MTTRNADLRLELFDGARWVPMEFPRDEAFTYEAVRDRGRLYVERGAAKSVRVQLRRYNQWITVKVITMTIVETDSEAVIFKSSVCVCGHLFTHHAGYTGFNGVYCAGKKCACSGFDLKEV